MKVQAVLVVVLWMGCVNCKYTSLQIIQVIGFLGAGLLIIILCILFSLEKLEYLKNKEIRFSEQQGTCWKDSFDMAIFMELGTLSSL